MGGRVTVAHGVDNGPVPDDLPYVPDTFLLQEGERFWMVERLSGKETDIGRTGYDHMASSGSFTVLEQAVPWEDGRWAAVEESGLAFFDKDGEDRWRSDRARELLAEGKALKEDPERALALFRASGTLVKIPVPSLVGHLERQRSSRNESLVDIYNRVKKSERPNE